MSISISSTINDYISLFPDEKNKLESKDTENITKKENNDDKKKDTNKPKKSSHITTMKKDRYLETYTVDESGNKVLIKRVPISKNTSKNKTSNISNNIINLSLSKFNYNQKINQTSQETQSLQEIINLLKNDSAI